LTILANEDESLGWRRELDVRQIAKIPNVMAD
jgi:hypothetical protein